MIGSFSIDMSDVLAKEHGLLELHGILKNMDHCDSSGFCSEDSFNGSSCNLQKVFFKRVFLGD
jgi:hypothetical protein